MFIFAHPDDEAVGVGARLGRFEDGYFIHVTDGAPRDEQDSRAHGFQTLSDYRDARALELEQALAVAGIPEVPRKCLQLPDQEAALHLVDLTRSLVTAVETYRPEVILTHPYEGGHPDHDACAFAVHHAVTFLNRGRPLIIEAASYHAGPQGMATLEFLPANADTRETFCPLSPEERQKKAAILSAFRSQREMLRNFPLDFERFRIAPTYDFREPPHQAPVLYDLHPWGMLSSRFCELAEQAELELPSAKDLAWH